MTFNEKRELEKLPAEIERLEGEQATLEETMAQPEFYQGDGEVIRSATERLTALAAELETAYARWESLESIAEA